MDGLGAVGAADSFPEVEPGLVRDRSAMIIDGKQAETFKLDYTGMQWIQNQSITADRKMQQAKNQVREEADSSLRWATNAILKKQNPLRDHVSISITWVSHHWGRTLSIYIF